MPQPGSPEFSEHWRGYHDAVEARPHNPFLDVLEPFLPAPGLALDIGCGTGKSTIWLLDRGFSVVGYDADPEALRRFQERVAGREGARAVLATFSEAEYPPCSLAVSVFSLFFCPRDEFFAAFAKIRAALLPGSVFGGQFLGPEDSWAGPETAAVTASEVDDLLSGMEVLHREEAKREGQTVRGDLKQWHIHHLVARVSGT